MGTLYENIKSLCDQKKIRPGRMCVETGISKGIMSDLKKGRKKSIQIETAQKIANYFDVPVDFLLNPDAENKDISFDNVDVDDPPALQLQHHQRSVDEIIAETEQKKESAPKHGNGLNMYDMSVLKWFHSLPEEKRQAILALGDAPAALREELDR